MADQQLVDYIKKAKDAGQSDDQTRALLYKNGWAEAEVSEAFSALSGSQPQAEEPRQQFRPEPQAQSKPQPQPQIQQQPKIQPAQPSTQVKIERPQTQSRPQAQPAQEYKIKPMRTGIPAILKLLIVLILLAIIGVAVYYATLQSGLLDSLLNQVSQQPSTQTPNENNPPAQNQNTQQPQVQMPNLITTKLSTVLQDYDVSKITIAAFSSMGDKTVFCAPKKADGKYDCFLNSVKLPNPYAFKPYWYGFSPDGKRLVFLYYDAAKKQSFAYENNVEGQRFEGNITYPNFSSDSKSFMFMVIDKNNKNYAVLDKKLFTPHDKIYTIPTLSSDGKYFTYGARDGQEIMWIVEDLTKTNAPQTQQ